MRWFVRRITRKGKGNVGYQDFAFDGDTLTIGRGADQVVALTDLRAALAHATLTALGNGKARIESKVVTGVRVDGRSERNAIVKRGSIMELGGVRLKLLDVPKGFDGAVEVSPLESNESRVSSQAMNKTLADTWLSKRRPAWILFAGVALLFLLLPMFAHFVPQTRPLLDAFPLTSRVSWQTGELARAHHPFGARCETCHEKPFQPVRDEACGACHGAIAAHADPKRFNLPELGDTRCAHCHRDHNGATALIDAQQSLCSDCHSDLQARSKNATKLIDAADFGTAHPPVKVNLPGWDAEGRFAPKRVELKPGLREASGIRFPHELHLRAEGLKGPEGLRRLECGSCHAAEPGGARMLPVDFETMCQSCHRLDFDVLAPDRQVPHGKVPEILAMLDEYYAGRALAGGYEDARAPMFVQQRRRPGQPLTPAQTVEARTWASRRASEIGESLFTGRACNVCHTVTRTDGQAQDLWHIDPVRVSGIWFAKSLFPHSGHATMACGDCHAAATSKSSTDLLIPGIDNCRQCHGGEAATNVVESTCITCHRFHDSPYQLMGDLQRNAREAAAAAVPVSSP